MLRKIRRPRPAEPIDVLRFLRSPAPTHWVARRKAAIALAVRAGLISLSDACDRYGLSVQEFEGWEAAFEDLGVGGLLAKRPTSKRKKSTIGAATVRPVAELPEVTPELQQPPYR